MIRFNRFSPARPPPPPDYKLSCSLTWHFVFLLLVHGAREGVAQGDGGEEHLDADDEVLPAGRHRAGAHHVAVDEERVGDDAAALQDGQHHACGAAPRQS